MQFTYDIKFEKLTHDVGLEGKWRATALTNESCL